MRYEIRWSNGAWKLFDTQDYCSVAAFAMKAWAEEALLNIASTTYA